MPTRRSLPRRAAATLALLLSALLAAPAPAAAQTDTRVDALYTAAAQNDTATVRRLLAAGVDPN